jgi:hypothetical protein
LSRVHTIEAELLPFDGSIDGLARFRADVERLCAPGGIPLRLIITKNQGNRWQCEVERLEVEDSPATAAALLGFRRRGPERASAFNAVMLIPTGINCEIGGHAGDATPAARLLASQCDHLILHPNVVNASDINEQTGNCLYVEGSIICRLLMGTIGLRKVRANRILAVTERRGDGNWVVDQVVNTAGAARATLGVDCVGVVELKQGPRMALVQSSSGRATGEITNLRPLLAMLRDRRQDYDAVALCTRMSPPIDISVLFDSYFSGEGPNPWGGAEAALTHAISTLLNVPSAHAPTLEDLVLRTHAYGRVDPRKAAEVISTSYAFSIFKGLHQAPAVVAGHDGSYEPAVLSAEDISCLVLPEGCVGIPTIAALLQEITVIVVRENRTMLAGSIEALPFPPGRLWSVGSYLEAAGLLAALRAGIQPDSVRRPLASTPFACQ